MKAAEILIKPILSEKSNRLTEKRNTYAFRVNRKANKLEIKKAVETFYGVNVAEVRTIVVPSKAKSRFTKAGVVSGRKPAYKKAYVTVAEGENIDLYANV
ncbi:MAG: 50S ribosomal protein L23 [Bacteroidetes bacterium]|nr:50S ribosomal protein L23 [Bacteroidota bacterium]